MPPRIEINVPQIQVPVAPLPSVGSAEAEIYGAAAREMHEIATVLNQRRHRQAIPAAARKVAALRQEFTNKLLSDDDGGMIDYGYTDNFIGAYQRRASELLRGAEEDYETEILTADFANLQGQLLDSALRREVAAGNVREDANARRAIDRWAATVWADPSQINAVQAERGMFMGDYRASPERRQALEDYGQLIGENALRGLARTDPARALEIVQGGANGYGIDAKRLPTLADAFAADVQRKVSESERDAHKRQTTALLEFANKNTAYRLGGARPDITPADEAVMGVDNTLRAQGALMESDAFLAKKSADFGAYVRAYAQGPVDLTDPVMKRGLEVVYENYLESIADQPPDVQRNNKVFFAEEHGGLPQSLLSELRAGLHASNDDAILAAADMVKQLQRRDPRLVQPLGADLKIADAITSQTDLGVDAKAAIENWRTENIQPEPQRTARVTAYKDLMKDPATGDVTRQVGEAVGAYSYVPATPVVLPGGGVGVLPFTGEAAPQVQIPEVAKEEYRRLRFEAFKRTGDLASADQFAAQTMKRQWGVTLMNGAPTISKFAPERFYGDPDLSTAQNWAWIEEQARNELKAKMGNIPEGQLLLTPSTQVRAPDGRPAYVVVIKTPDGKYQAQLTNGKPSIVFVPDFAKAARAGSAERHKAQIDAAREKRRKADEERKAREEDEKFGKPLGVKGERMPVLKSFN